MPKKIRVVDIAKEAGVSNATVSRVINNQKVVNDETYKKVIAAMHSLGYQHDTKGTASGTHDIIVFCLPHINNPFYNGIMKGAKSAAQRYGYHLVIHIGNLENEDLSQFISFLKKSSVCGIITLNSLTAKSLEKLEAATTVVQCCEFCEEYDLPYVSIDDYQATKTALDYLVSCGRKKIALINGPIEYKYARHRRRGYVDFMAENNLSYNNEWIVQLPDINFDMANAAITQLLSKNDRPDAIFAVSDVYANAAIKVAHKRGLKVPEDIAIMGFDNIDISSMSEPSLTTVSQPKMQMGYMACELLIEKVANPDVENKYIILDTELIIRESTMV